MQEMYGVKCSSYGTYFRIGETPVDDLPYYIEAARILGTDVLRLWAGRRCAKELSLSEIEKFMEASWRAADIAEREGVTLCLECHQNSFTERLDDAMMLMDNVGSDKFKMYWQPFRARSFEENLEYLKKIEQYVVNIHVFNWDAAGRYPLIDAADVWKKYLAALSRPRTLLLEFMPDDNLATLPREADALRKIIM